MYYPETDSITLQHHQKKCVKGVQDERKLFVIFAFLCGKFQLSRFNESNSQETFQNFETSFKHK